MKPAPYWPTLTPTFIAQPYDEFMHTEIRDNRTLNPSMKKIRTLTFETFYKRLVSYGLFSNLAMAYGEEATAIERRLRYRLVSVRDVWYIEVWLNHQGSTMLLAVERYIQRSMTRPFQPLFMVYNCIVFVDGAVVSQRPAEHVSSPPQARLMDYEYVFKAFETEPYGWDGPGNWDDVNRDPDALSIQWKPMNTTPLASRPFNSHAPVGFGAPSQGFGPDLNVKEAMACRGIISPSSMGAYAQTNFSGGKAHPTVPVFQDPQQQEIDSISVAVATFLTKEQGMKLALIFPYHLAEHNTTKTSSSRVAVFTLMRYVKHVHPEHLAILEAQIDSILTENGGDPEYVITTTPVMIENVPADWKYSHAVLSVKTIIDTGAGVRAEANSRTFTTILK